MRQDPPLPAGPGGIYLHVPFCRSRCTYCDFTTVAGREERIDRYLETLEREIEGTGSVREGMPEVADTVYVGGGTPSLLAPERVGRLVEAVRNTYRLEADAEITLEANPDDVTTEAIEGWERAGINRISLGVQSLDDDVLRVVERRHDSGQALAALRRCVESGISRVNVDLILGLPGEKLHAWAGTVEAVAGYGPDHVSVYLLETDKDTPLSRSLRDGALAPEDERGQLEALLATDEILARHGLARYEISNYSLPGRESRHNLKYWTDMPYAGYGLASHGYAGGERRANLADLDRYIRAVRAGADPVDRRERWEPFRRIEEALFMGLRLDRGVDLGDLGRRYGLDLWQAYRTVWTGAEEAGLLERRRTSIRLTSEGRIRSNQVFREILGHRGDPGGTDATR